MINWGLFRFFRDMPANSKSWLFVDLESTIRTSYWGRSAELSIILSRHCYYEVQTSNELPMMIWIKYIDCTATSYTYYYTIILEHSQISSSRFIYFSFKLLFIVCICKELYLSIYWQVYHTNQHNFFIQLKDNYPGFPSILCA